MEYYIGQIELFAINFEPGGWMRCDGRLLPIDSNQTLFALIGNRFGGDGAVNFALPNLTTSEFGNIDYPMIRYYIATDGIWPERSY